MHGDPGPMVRRRQLSAILRRYRIESGMSVKEVAERLFESPSKVTRIEKGQRLATLRDIRDLCDIYGIPDEVREQLMSLARDSREREWWQQADLSPALQILIGMEGSAKAISEFELAIFPGLLQTKDYANAILRQWIPEDAAKRQLAVDVRMRRQQIFQHPERPAVRMVLDEAAIRRAIGGPDVMREQLKHVSDMIATAGIELRIIPFSAGMHVGITNGFTVLEFENLTSLAAEPAIPGVVYLETSGGDKYFDAAADVDDHLTRFERLRAQALTIDQSIELLRTAVADL